MEDKAEKKTEVKMGVEPRSEEVEKSALKDNKMGNFQMHAREDNKKGNLTERLMKEEKVMIGAIGEGNGEQKAEMMFQVCGVQRVLAAVARILEKGNRVVFDEESYIENKATRKKIPMSRKGRSFVMDVVMEGGKAHEITIDSAAEESVSPDRWPEEFGIERVEAGEELQEMERMDKTFPISGGGMWRLTQRFFRGWANFDR
jgi:hypothetical protein